MGKKCLHHQVFNQKTKASPSHFFLKSFSRYFRSWRPASRWSWASDCTRDAKAAEAWRRNAAAASPTKRTRFSIPPSRPLTLGTRKRSSASFRSKTWSRRQRPPADLALEASAANQVLGMDQLSLEAEDLVSFKAPVYVLVFFCCFANLFSAALLYSNPHLCCWNIFFHPKNLHESFEPRYLVTVLKASLTSRPPNQGIRVNWESHNFHFKNSSFCFNPWW